ncbi:uncharacterized protein K452DRAFT_359628 [Aplosporella prunicola CBS 121167]|uniref:Uncharacterized protein n=1 Tax=Aplosporella prunicola CBS 121167 TaxID=1176127 RepID=A0A6A6B8M5_9PEZI|nr:uncharacterized protein K452DRAFT_359628 [Aplosporella prunicola CBS 121167]KAF2140582.1 hypothetical protein K452DRAFT_359628 [Aplosporella prunicola CBS 121167]
MVLLLVLHLLSQFTAHDSRHRHYHISNSSSIISITRSDSDSTAYLTRNPSPSPSLSRNPLAQNGTRPKSKANQKAKKKKEKNGWHRDRRRGPFLACSESRLRVASSGARATPPRLCLVFSCLAVWALDLPTGLLPTAYCLRATLPAGE